MNYYVLQVAPREEEKTEEHIRKLLPAQSYEQCFHVTRVIQKKFHGEWAVVREKLLPGYVFVTTADAQTFYFYLKKVPLLTRMLGRDLECFVRLSEEEVQWLDVLLRQSGEAAVASNRSNSQVEDKKDGRMASASAGTDGLGSASRKYEVGLSQIDIREGNEIRIISGPLVDMEGMVKKINLHRRIAEVEVPFMNGKTVIYLGVEMVERIGV